MYEHGMRATFWTLFFIGLVIGATVVGVSAWVIA